MATKKTDKPEVKAEEVKAKETSVKKYHVLENFRETPDQMHLYKKDELYPREGYKPSEKRIKQLITDDNKEGRPFIVEEE